MSSARRVADIPELVNSITAVVSNRRSLVLVSRGFFYSVAPLIWESVSGVDLLLRLIPGISESRNMIRSSANMFDYSRLVVSLFYMSFARY